MRRLLFSFGLVGLVACGGGDDVQIDDAGSDVGVEGDGRASGLDGATGTNDGARPGEDGAADDAARPVDASSDHDEPSDARPPVDAAGSIDAASDASADASARDAALPPDASTSVDAGVRDAAPVDGSASLDAGTADAGHDATVPPPDAGPSDAGQDATIPPPPPIDAGAEPDAAVGSCTIPANAFTATDPAIDWGPAEVAPAKDEVQLINLKANALVYDPHSRHLFATTPSTIGAQGNSIVTIDPVSASILSVTYVGSEPTHLVVSRDGQFLYTNLRGANAILRFDIATSKASLQFPVGNDAQGYPLNAIDLKVLPHSPHSVLVTAPYPSYSNVGLLGVYDDGVLRPVFQGPNGYPTYYGPAFLLASNSDALAFGMDANTSTLVELCIDAHGVQPGRTQTGFTANVTQLAYSSPNIYASSGSVFDVVHRTFIGTFALPAFASNAASGVALDTSANRAYFLSAGFGTSGILAFDESHFTPTGSISVPPLPATDNGASQLVRWGHYGLAFITVDGQIAIVRSPVVAHP